MDRLGCQAAAQEAGMGRPHASCANGTHI